MTLNKASKKWLVIGCLLAAAAVGLGAFGAHGLESLISKTYDALDDSTTKQRIAGEPANQTETKAQFVARRLANWETAARYQMYHSFGLILLGLVGVGVAPKLSSLTGGLFLGGIILFSGMLYLLVLTNMKMLGAIVPLGGVSFIIGWVCFAFAVWKNQE